MPPPACYLHYALASEDFRPANVPKYGADWIHAVTITGFPERVRVAAGDFVQDIADKPEWMVNCYGINTSGHEGILAISGKIRLARVMQWSSQHKFLFRLTTAD